MLTFPDGSLGHAELHAAARALAGRLAGLDRAAVWATPSLHTCVAVTAALTAGVPTVPLNPRSGQRELAHIVSDSAPDAVLAAPGEQLAPALARRRRIDVDPTARSGDAPPGPDPESPALIIYTSGTTGPPKGAVLSHRALVACLDGLAEAWNWTGADTVVQALPLFHVHGLVQGVLGPLRRGGGLVHQGRFDPAAIAAALDCGATMLFAVPTMHHRLADAAEADPALARSLARARLLVSGSAPLPASLHERIRALSGQRVLERYGMTETLLTCSNPVDGERRPGTVGRPLPGVGVRLVDEAGGDVAADGATLGELWVRGPTLFTGYLDRPEATARAMRDGWFTTGDIATRSADGYVRLVGRRSTDLIDSGGYRIGAGEVENALLEHPAVAEVAVAGRPDEELGQQVTAWVVPAAGARPGLDELAEHVSWSLAPHKRPRAVHLVERLPRNDMGKVVKQDLH